MTRFSSCVALLLALLTKATVAAPPKPAAYLFVYFTGNDNKKQEEAIRFALSADGFHYTALNGNRPVVNSAVISETGGVRDPHILRGADGKTFYMVATDMVSAQGWTSNRGLVLLKSTDLVNWTHHVVNFQKRYPGQENLKRVWAPQTIYDAQAKKYLVYFSLQHGTEPDKLYYAYANKDFTDLESEPKPLYASPTNSPCIDPDIVARDGKFYLFFKTEESQNKGIKVAVSDKLTSGYVARPPYVQQTSSPVEGAGTFRLNDSGDYVLMYDMYTSGRYQFTRTRDLEHFEVIDNQVTMNFRPRHGTVLPLTAAEATQLAARYLAPADVLPTAANPALRPLNTVVDTLAGTATFLAEPGTQLAVLDPAFGKLPGVRVSPAGPQDFSRGPVRYTVAVGKRQCTWAVAVRDYHNPALTGYYADPDILYAPEKKRFYMYPTSDGFKDWSGTYFKAYSSADLVHWRDEGVILDLAKQVSWEHTRAWAPTMLAQPAPGGGTRYAFYYCAGAKIGVALGSSPTGPFIDSGQSLLNQKPEGIKRGQQIDPVALHDPQSGKNYLYWGNAYMAGAELNDDLVSLKSGTTQVMTPDATYGEGTYVFYRKGIYYFMWSQNDTRSPDYQVLYGTCPTPLGKIATPANNLILKKNPALGIYGTGHHSVIQVPGRDEWYIVYHRFTYPNGLAMGTDAGFNREVCIDKLEFNADGTIRPVVVTHEGIAPVKVP